MKCDTQKVLVIIAILCGVALLIILAAPSAADSGTAASEPTIVGVSHREGSNFFQVAVEEHSRMAFPVVTWHIYLPENATVKHLIDGETVWEENLTAGLHLIERTYEPGSYEMRWQIGLVDRFDYNVRITTSSQEVIEEEDSDMIMIEPGTLNNLEWETGGGALALALVPSVFMIPYHKAKKEEATEDVL